MAKVIAAVPDKDISRMLEQLSHDDWDLLMKYLYRAMASAGKTSPALLKWHGALSELAGIGSIVRVLTDKKTV